jgi:hypothetical protein
MKVFFIYPSVGSQLGFNYGVAHMASVLKRAGHQVGFWQLCEDVEPLLSGNQSMAIYANAGPLGPT